MLPKYHRLKKNRHFTYIYKHGKAKHSKMLSLIFVRTRFKPYKIGFTVSKKIGKSVVRSTVKRRMREAFKKLMPDVNDNFNYIFIAREGIENLCFNDIVKEMEYLLTKSEMLGIKPKV